MVNDIRDAYLESKVMAADPVELIRMLYEGALKSIGEARRLLNAGDIRGRSRAITKTTEFLAELVSSLDTAKGGEIALRLNQLYGYMLQRLADANREQAEMPLIEVANLLATLDEAWAEVARGRQPAPSMDYAAVGADGGEYLPQSWSA